MVSPTLILLDALRRSAEARKAADARVSAAKMASAQRAPNMSVQPSNIMSVAPKTPSQPGFLKSLAKDIAPDTYENLARAKAAPGQPETQALEGAKAAVNLPKELILQPAARLVTQLGQEVVTGGAAKPWTPQNKVVQQLIGKQEVKPIGEELESQVRSGYQAAKKYNPGGLDPNDPTSKIFAALATPAFALGAGSLKALDVETGGGGTKKAASKTAKKLVGELAEKTAKETVTSKASKEAAMKTVRELAEKAKAPLPTAKATKRFLTRDLAGAKPRYNYGQKSFTPVFTSDLDKAAYILAQASPSKRDADYLKQAVNATGMTPAQLRAHGSRVRLFIKQQAKTSSPGELLVPEVPVSSALAPASPSRLPTETAIAERPPIAPSPIQRTGTPAPIDELSQKTGQTLTGPASPAGGLSYTDNLAENVPPVKGDMSVPAQPAGKQRGLITSVADAGNENFTPDVKQSVRSAENIDYTPITNASTMSQARKAVADDPLQAYSRVMKTDKYTADSAAEALALAQKFQGEGRVQEATDVITHMAEKATEAGQFVQALRLWSAMTPEGAVLKAQRLVDAANKANIERLGGRAKEAVLDEKTAKEIRDITEQISKTKAGSRERDILVARREDLMASLIPTETAKYVSTVQVMAQLLNFKTPLRNVIGNTVATILENISDTIGAAIDTPWSLLTGKRSKGLPEIMAQLRGAKEGFKLGLEDAVRGIDTAAGSSGKFGTSARRTFRKGPLGIAEKGLNITLKAPDRAAYEAAYQGTIAELLKLNKLTSLEDASPALRESIEETAKYTAQYRTFQNESTIATLLSKLKQLLNDDKIAIVKGRTSKDNFGLGNVLLNYPKVPGNLISFSLDYSPVGFAKSLMELVRPLIGGDLSYKTFNRRKFIEATSRALTGTAGLAGTGAILYNLGIITNKGDDRSDVAALDRATGLGRYKLNVSALKRFVMSGFDKDAANKQEGDIITNYDWMQPAAMSMSLGANVAEAHEKGSGLGVGLAGGLQTLATAAVEAANTIVEQPVFSGISQFKYSKDVLDAAKRMFSSVPASFVPSLLGHIRTMADNSVRDTSDKNYYKEVLNRVIDRLPGLSTTLPQAYSTLGEPLQKDMSGAGPLGKTFNALVNPANISRYQTTPGIDMLKDIADSTGNVRAIPNPVSPNQTMFRQDFELKGEDKQDLQRKLGKANSKVLESLADSEEFNALSDFDKEKAIVNIQGKLSDVLKYEAFLKSQGMEVPKNVPVTEQIKVLDKLSSNETYKALPPEKQKKAIRHVIEALQKIEATE